MTPRPKFTSQANPEQLKAIKSTEGPLLIFAGPGSGKTYGIIKGSDAKRGHYAFLLTNDPSPYQIGIN